MAITYQRNTWETGKVITAKALNDIETGIVNIVETLNGMDSQVESQALTVNGDANIGGDTTVTGEATFNGSVEINGATALKGATIISGATTINNNVTVGANQHIILLESSSESPNENNYVVTKGYVDNQVSIINNKTIASGNAGIVSSGKLGVDNGITLTLQPATSETLGGIKVGDNLTINETTGELSGNYSVATASAAGLMSAAHFTKLEGISENATNNIGTVTGISINGGATQSPTNGVVNISDNIVTSIKINNVSQQINNGEVNLSVITDITGKADAASPSFTGIASFGNDIKIDGNAYKIILGSAELNESQLNTLYSILPQDSISDGEYTLKLSKSTVDNEPVFTYEWVPVPQQESGGEGS